MPEMLRKEINGVVYDYAIFPLIPNTSEILRTPTKQFDFVNPSIDPMYLALSLAETMLKNRGVGLAAPQIGRSERVFAIGVGSDVKLCFNPIFEKVDEELTSFEEGCLSFRGLYLRIKRPEKINVTFQDVNGEIVKETFTGLTSRTFQHELDHLNGILYTSLIHPYMLDKAKSKVKTNLKRLKQQEENQIRQELINKAIQSMNEQKKIEQLEKQINLNIPDATITLSS